MTFKTIVMIFICVVLFEMFPWPLDMIIAFVLISKHTQNFVIRPLARYLSINGRTPENYMFRKLKTIREVIWFFAIIMGLEIVFIFELLAIGISCKIINNIKNKMGISTSVFSKDDYNIYNEYLRYSEDNPPLVEDAFYEELDDDYMKKQEYNYEKVIDNKNVKINVKREYASKDMIKNDVLEEQVDLFKEQVEEKIENYDEKNEDIKTDFTIETTPIETTSKFDFNKPIGDISISSSGLSTDSENTGLKEDEIACEKCGTIMSKNKIACPKCGTLVKYKPRR